MFEDNLTISRKYKIGCIVATSAICILDLLIRRFAETKTINTGIAFGLWKSHELTNIASVVLFALFIFFVIKFGLWKLINKTRAGYLGGCFFLGGACCNAIERILLGHVTDYIEIISKLDLNLNFADLMLIAGFMCIAYALLHSSQK